MTDTVRESSSGKGEADLLPCPICGGVSRRNGRGNVGGALCADKTHRVQAYGKTQADADAAWNTRAALSTPDRARVEVLEEAARVAERWCEQAGSYRQDSRIEELGDDIAAAIRALAHTPAVSGQAEGGVR